MPHLTVQSTTCTASKRGGAFCDRESLPDAPFPICVKHAAEVLRYLNSVMPDGGVALTAARAVEDARLPSIPMPDEDSPIVYYMRIGEHIKIGYSANFTVRRRFYPPDAELLAVEPGDTALELERLRQFRKDLRGRREWFAPSDELMSHIEGLQAATAA